MEQMEETAVLSDSCRRFLRKPTQYHAGDRLPDFPLDRDGQFTLYRQLADGGYILTLSTGCRPCLYWLNKLQDKAVLAKLILLIDCDEAELGLIQEALGDRLELYARPIEFMVDQLKVPAIPWVYRIDRSMRITVSEPISPNYQFSLL